MVCAVSTLSDDLVNDLAYAARILRKTPTFAIAAILTIALGIGASTAIFSVTDAVLFRPLPYKNPDRLVLANDLLSNAYFFDLRNGATEAFETMAAVMVFRAVVPREDGTAERISKGLITTNFLRMLGAQICSAAISPRPMANQTARRRPRFHRRRARWPSSATTTFSGATALIRPSLGARCWAPRGPARESSGCWSPVSSCSCPAAPVRNPVRTSGLPTTAATTKPNRGELMLQVIGALKPGVSLDRAQSQIDRVAATWRADRLHVRLEPWHKTLVAEVRPALLALMGAVTFLLLDRLCQHGEPSAGTRVTCASANLPCVLRSVLEPGASLARCSPKPCCFAAWARCSAWDSPGSAFVSCSTLAPPNLPRLESTSIDWRVLAFSALAGVLESAMLGVLPGWRAARPDVMQMLRSAGRTAALGNRRLASIGRRDRRGGAGLCTARGLGPDVPQLSRSCSKSIPAMILTDSSRF